MIRITQGHEKGIGLEVFLKSVLLLNQNQLDQFVLYCFKSTLEENLKILNFDYSINDDVLSLITKKINCKFQNDCHSPQSSTCLDSACADIKDDEFLFTLPTSKNQILLDGKATSGHTEYFRQKYKKSHLPMMFYGPKGNTLLITDHSPISALSSIITQELIEEKIAIALNSLGHIREIYIAGLNPHAGEDGLIGNEDKRINEAIKKLNQLFPKKKFVGPLPGDTLHNYEKGHHQLLVYCYHDQGLTKFKAENGFYGLNITLGLPYLRTSVDHGTAFDIYGKNIANYMGCYWGLIKTLNWKSLWK